MSPRFCSNSSTSTRSASTTSSRSGCDVPIPTGHAPQLAQMTSGYVDYVIGNTEFEKALYENPFRQWEPTNFSATRRRVHCSTSQEPLELRTHQLRPTRQGTREATGKDMPKMLGRRGSPAARMTTLPTRSPRRSQPLTARVHKRTPCSTPRYPVAHRFYEESTYWNPSWTITHGAIQTTTSTTWRPPRQASGRQAAVEGVLRHDGVHRPPGKTHACPAAPPAGS